MSSINRPNNFKSRVIPVEHEDQPAIAELRFTASQEVHSYDRKWLESMRMCEDELLALLDLRSADSDLEYALHEALGWALEQMENPNATVCGIVIGVLGGFLQSHPTFHDCVRLPQPDRTSTRWLVRHNV